MYTGDWLSGACPRCLSGEALRKVRADATAFTCQVCRYDWAVKRMPSSAEAADIVRRSRQTRAEALINADEAESMDGGAPRDDNASSDAC
jgi:hypothetical protein